MTRIIKTIHHYPTLHTLFRSMSVGALATFIDMAVFSMLHLFLGFPIIAANTISYGAGSLNSFSMHRAWTYADRPRRALGLQLLQFLAVGIGALLINDLFIYLAPHISLLSNMVDNNGMVTKACATGVGMVWNFIINHFWTFRKISQ